MKKIVLFLLITSIVLALGCANTTVDTPENTPVKNQNSEVELNDYTLIQDDGVWSIKLNEAALSNDNNIDGIFTAEISFENEDEMAKAIKEDNFDSKYKKVLKAFSNADGIIELCFDLDNIPSVSIPDGFVKNGVVWEGCTFGYNLLNTNGENVFIDMITHDSMESKYNKFISIPFSGEIVSDMEENNLRTIVFKTSSMKVKYVIYKEENLYILETYYLEKYFDYDDQIVLSDTVPVLAIVLGENDGIYYRVNISNKNYHYSIDEYKQFYLYFD